MRLFFLFSSNIIVDIDNELCLFFLINKFAIKKVIITFLHLKKNHHFFFILMAENFVIIFARKKC